MARRVTLVVSLLLAALGVAGAGELKIDRVESEGLAFGAVKTQHWPAEMIPIYAIELKGVKQLRRYPLKGQEHLEDPAFFGMPLDGESAALNGRWEVVAIQRNGSNPRFYWELAADGGNVIGRFDKETDFRFAQVIGGTFESNRLELKIQYVMDFFEVKAELRDGKLSGTWRQTNDNDSGTWEAKRADLSAPKAGGLVELIEWKRGSEFAYRLGNDPMPQGWKKVRPLCRVWPVRQTNRE